MLEWTRDFLARKGIEQPRLSAEWLLCAATGLSRVELYMNYDRPLDRRELDAMHAGVIRRAKGEPLQYVTGEMPFRHIVLRCAPGVLIPRPETEILVDEVLAYVKDLPMRESPQSPDPSPMPDAAEETPEDGGEDEAVAYDFSARWPSDAPRDVNVLEVGTGTGCIALSLAGESPRVRVSATDISPEAIELAERNRDALGLSECVKLFRTDLAEGVPGAREASFDVLVSNPPYIPTAVIAALPREVGDFEPRLALDGGADGLDVFRRLVDLGTHALRAGGLFACELFEDSLEEASALPALRSSYENIRIVRDLTGRNRHLVATLREGASQ